MRSKISLLTSDLTLMYARGYGAPSCFHKHSCTAYSWTHDGSGRQRGEEARRDRHEGVSPGSTSEEMLWVEEHLTRLPVQP
jgi:hypothetical protein